MKVRLVSVILMLCGATAFGQGKGVQQAATEIQASKVITYTNEIIALNNEAIKRLNEYNRVLEEAQNCMERISSGKYDPKFPAPFSTQTAYPIPAGYLAKYEEAEAKAVAFPEKSELMNLVAVARKMVGQLEASSNRMGDYFKQKEFENDKDYVQYNALLDSLISYHKVSRTAWRQAVNRASYVGDAAELVLLKTNKIASFIIPMKTDVNYLKNVLNRLYDIANEDEISSEALKSLQRDIAKLNAQLATDKSLQGKNVSLIKHESDYTTFFEHAEACTKNMILVIDELLKPTPNEDDVDTFFRRISQEYNQTVDYYNNFVESGAK